MFKDIPRRDITTREFETYKDWHINQILVNPLYGVLTSGSYFDETDEKNSNGISKRLLYDTIRRKFYSNSQLSSPLNDFGFRLNYNSSTERVLGDSIAIISLDKDFYGERIKRGSLSLEYGGLKISDDSYSNLLDQIGNHKGNVFYDQGLIVITDDVYDSITLSEYSLNYKSVHTIFEKEIFIPVLEHEFNVSQNPTAYIHPTGEILWTGITSSYDSTKVGGFGDYMASSSLDPTGSYLAPYITTIGLYDDDSNLVALAKLAFPIKSLPDYPVNFLIRLDV